MDVKLLTSALDARLAYSRHELARLKAERAELLAHADGVTEPWQIELGLVADYDARPGHNVVLVVARRLLETGPVHAYALDDEAAAPQVLFLYATLDAADELTAYALANGLVLQAGGQTEFYDPEMGRDWDFNHAYPVARAEESAWLRDGSVAVSNAVALAALTDWEQRASAPGSMLDDTDFDLPDFDFGGPPESTGA